MRCNSNKCPTGVATQRPWLVRGLHVPDKAERVFQYHRNTIESAMELLGAAGIQHPDDLRPWHIDRRTAPDEVRDYAEIYRYLEPGDLLDGRVPDRFRNAWEHAQTFWE